MNTSQDPEYEGETFHEKKVHQDHFTFPEWRGKKTHPKDDPRWIRIGPGRWKLKQEKEDA